MSFGATQMQGIAGGVLNTLKLEQQETGGPPGSPWQYKVTPETIEYLQSLEGKTLVIDGDGSVKVE